MLLTLFGHLTSERLPRLRYLGYNLLLVLIGVIALIAAAALIGISEQMAGGDLVTSQQQVVDSLGVPLMLGALLIIAALAFAGSNIMAKRIRDIGLPGWWVVATIYAVELLVALTITPILSALIHLLLLAALLLVASGSVVRRYRSQYGNRDF